MGICVSRVFRQIQGGRQRSLRNGNQGSATGQKDQKASLSHLLKTTHKICHHRRPENTSSSILFKQSEKGQKRRLYDFDLFVDYSSSYNTHQKMKKQPLYASIPCR